MKRTRLEPIHVGVVDVGSNTIRLLVAEVTGKTLVPRREARVRLPIGEDIEREGAISETNVEGAAEAVRKFCGIARHEHAAVIDVFVTAPGRQSANATHLVASLRRAAQQQVRVLTSEQEGRFSYAGAVLTARVDLPERVAVCDVGGGSTAIMAGKPQCPPNWATSVDLGSARLSARAETPASARATAAAAFGNVDTPTVDLVLVAGGSARATRTLVGPSLGHAELSRAQRLVDSTEPRMLAQRFGIDETRARVLPGGVAILAVIQDLFNQPLQVCDGGVREGAALAAAGVWWAENATLATLVSELT
jgi:exopolyphosphatase/guanosine-5'-triphosphate,3'-diphosphate pyrophosphatase